MKYIPFVSSCFLELKKCGWLGQEEGAPLSMFKEGETAILTFMGGDLYGLLIQDTLGDTTYVDQFVSFHMACDIARAFMVK